MPNAQDAALEEDFDGKKLEMRNAAKDSVVVVDNLPEVGPEKFEKLCERVFPIFERAGAVAKGEDGKPRIQMVKNSDETTCGYAFVEYESPEEAFKAVRTLHNHALSKKHVFWVDTAGALERLQAVPNEFQPPQQMSQPSEGQADYKSWLLDSRGRDMFMIRADTETSVYWNDHVVKPSIVRHMLTNPFFFRALAQASLTVMDIPTDECSSSPSTNDNVSRDLQSRAMSC